MKYILVPTRTNVRRSFKIICGLREGYNVNAKICEGKGVIDAVHQWMKKRAQKDEPFLTGSFSREVLTYTWKGAENNNDAPEPAIVFQGEVSIAHNPQMEDKEAIELLNEIAIIIATSTKQTRIYVAYGDEIWILQEEGKDSPRENKKKKIK